MTAIRTNNNFAIAFVCAIAWVLTTPAGAVSIGDSVDSVIQELGAPPNTIRIGARQVFDYARGRVEFEDGVVSQVDLISDQEAEERGMLQEEQRALERERMEARRMGRLREGLALRTATLSDPNFRAAPASERAAFWRDFSIHYPDIPIAAEYQQALRQLRDEQSASVAAAREAAEMEERLRRLEQELRAAQLRAFQAEEQAALARLRTDGAERADAPVPPTVQVFVNVPYYVETVFVPTHPVARPDPPPAPTEPLLGRYSISRRFLSDGRPVFGGMTPASSR